MQPNDRKEFAEILNGIALIKPGNSKLPAEALLMFWNCMQSWEIGEFRAAATQLAASCEFMPNPYHFEQLRKKADVGKHEAWSVALERCKRHVTHPEDRITRAVRLVGGYMAIGHTDNDELHWMAKRFMEAFEEVGEAEQARQALPNYAPHVGKLEARGVMAMLEAKAKEVAA